MHCELYKHEWPTITFFANKRKRCCHNEIKVTLFCAYLRHVNRSNLLTNCKLICLSCVNRNSGIFFYEYHCCKDRLDNWDKSSADFVKGTCIIYSTKKSMTTMNNTTKWLTPIQ